MTRDALWERRLLLLVTAVLVVFGIAAVAGAAEVGPQFAVRQAVGGLVGAVALVAAALAPPDLWRRLAWPILAVVAVLLITVLLPFTQAIAPQINGARRWLTLGIVTVQPGELTKFAIVGWTAMLAAKKGPRVREMRRGLMPFLVVLVPVFILLALQPHLSMAVLVAMLAAIVLFIAGARLGHFLLLGGVGGLAVYGQITSVPYRLARIVTFLNPGDVPADASAQIRESLIGFGAGRVLGVGLGEGQQKLGYLPYSYSDFIFSSIGEEWGFLGATLLVLLFALYGWVGFRIARTAADPFGRYLAGGFTAMIVLTALLHMAVNLALLPTTGLTLPFISYGRSSLIVALAATGVILSVARARA